MESIKYIPDIIGSTKICKYDLVKGIAVEIAATKEILKDKGVYSSIEGSAVKLVGVTDSKNGPVMFVDDRQYIFKNTDFSFVQKECPNNRGVFYLYLSGKVKEKIEYEKPMCLFDPWFTEQDLDIFHWLLEFSENETGRKKFLSYFMSK